MPNQEIIESSSTLEIRQQKSKELLIEQLKKTPIIQVACEKVEVSRASFYRYRKDDKEFAEAVDKAISEGASLVNDLAESQLMSAIKNNNLTAIMFWLKHRHNKYTNKVEVVNGYNEPIQELSPEQEALVQKALQMAALIPQESETSHEPPTATT